MFQDFKPEIKLFLLFLLVALIAVVVSVVGILLLKTMEFGPPSSMEMRTVVSCDLNANGQCDAADLVLFKQAFGKKVGDVGYNLSADVDADGVVTAVDQQMLFPATSSQPRAIDRSGWQTYHNVEFGFEVKYPSEYDEREFCRPRVVDGREEGSLVFLGPIIIRKVKTEGLNLEEYVTKMIQDAEKEDEDSATITFSAEPREHITFAGKEAIKVFSHFCGADCSDSTNIYVNNNGESFRIYYADDLSDECLYGGDTQPAAGSDIANEILPTFRFLK